MPSSLARVQRDRDGRPFLSKETIELPELEPQQVLVKVEHVAQNPTDVQSFDGNAFGDGAVVGCDFTGTVEDLGGSVTRLRKGDKVAGLVWGGEIKGLGAYSEYCYADERISFKVPNGVSSEAAATVPLAACTAWLALFSKECLSIPRKTGSTSVLIWGGSSSVGSYAIQLARLYGFNIVTTCSPRNFDAVKALGATHVFDYNDKSVVEKIRKAAPDLSYVFDTIGNKESSGLGSKAVHSSGGALCTVRPGKANTENVASHVKVTDVLVWTAFLKDHAFGDFKWPASKEDHELCAELFEKIPGWLSDGTLIANNVKSLKGLDAVDEGFQMHRDGKISSFKIVYTMKRAQ